MQQQVLRWKRLPLAIMTLTLAVLGGVILAASLNLRREVRRQILDRDGEILQAVSLMQQYADEPDRAALGKFASMDDPAEQFNHILKISRLKGMLGIRLFTANGVFTNAFPEYVADADLPAGDLATLRELKPVTHFEPNAPLSSVDLLDSFDGPEKLVPLLEVNVPLQAKGESRLLGVAQFILQGDSIATQYAALDSNLLWKAALEFLASGAILLAAQIPAFRKVQRANRLLAAQGERLARANQALTLAAKTSAVGAVTSHLIHGLKNPLSGLQGFVKSRGNGPESEADWQDAIATTQRMQTLIGGVVRILEEQQAIGNYEISFRELVDIISSRMMPVARAAGVHFYAQSRAEGMLGNREANLTILILENLVQNAFHATPEGKSVRLTLAQSGGKIRCEVHDEGPGFPEGLKPQLFSPCRSTKNDGSGIGLAISKQLALNIGAELELKSSSTSGCVFCLVLPQKLTVPTFVPPESIQR
jgi:signal transduction histidine kinase